MLKQAEFQLPEDSALYSEALPVPQLVKPPTGSAEPDILEYKADVL